MTIDRETAIRAIVSTSTKTYASGFAYRHLEEAEDDEGTINMKVHNVFIAALGRDIQFYSALARSLDSSLGNMLEKMAIGIAELSYDVNQHVEGYITHAQTEQIATLLEQYKRNAKKPSVADYTGLATKQYRQGDRIEKRHESDYYLIDKETDMHYLIELKIGGDLDNKKARSEKEALLEQYCILANSLNGGENIKLCFATAYNRYGEGKPWKQTRVLQFFAEEELLISRAFWNMICKTDRGYDIVLDEYRKCAPEIVSALSKIKKVYLP